MKNKDPAFLFYPSDFLTGTMFMSDEQVGKYIRLLCSQHQFGRLSEKHMLKICNSYDVDIYSKFEKDDDGFYYNERLEKEINKRRKYCESRRNNRVLGKKAQEDIKNICSTYDETYVGHMENGNININNNINNNILNNLNYETLFFDFWQNYIPVKCDGRFVDKGSKKLSFEKFVRILKSGVKYEDIITGLHAYLNHCRENKQLTCTVPVFLNQQRWADDYNTSTIIAEDTARKRQEPKSIVETYAEIAAKYAAEDNLY